MNKSRRGRLLGLAHVLSGYGTAPAGEIQVGGFTGGYKKHNPVFVILFVMLTFSAGINMTPLDQPIMHGILATEGLAEKFLTAVERGSRVPIDLSDRGRNWFATDSPLKGAGFEPSVPRDSDDGFRSNSPA